MHHAARACRFAPLTKDYGPGLGKVGAIISRIVRGPSGKRDLGYRDAKIAEDRPYYGCPGHVTTDGVAMDGVYYSSYLNLFRLAAAYL